ncbi:MAG: reprolysin-like metallopeptidase, partial [Parafilimonas sp.]
TIIFLNGKTDPFQSSSLGYFSGKWNTQAQQTMDSYIGSANYDIGHLLMGYATGGNAGCIGCVCNAGNKGAGATGFKDDLTSDPFIVDFWDHEIGHQFGANHTFDYNYEGSIAQMEPGSGSTIMGYAGTTGATDLQPHSDPYFHAVSIQQIDTYITTGTGSTCGVLKTTKDHIPTAKAGSNYTIPASTPFALNGNSTDKDALDSLTYCWEQYDVFQNNGTSNKYPNANSTTGPVFRSLTPTISKQRNFPALSSILDGTNGNEWEVLPAVSRTLHFRLTVRDNYPGKGSTASDDMTVTVDGNSGPFNVTYPNTAVNITGGKKKTITWNVANTNLAPVNCANVSILLSTDGGLTFPTVLAGIKPNNGSAKILIPAINTTHARIKVVGKGNIFFDVSDADFTITSSGSFAADDASANTIAKTINVHPNPAKDFTNVVFNASANKCDLELSSSAGKIVYRKSLNNISKGNTERIPLTGFSKGVYMLKITTDTGTQTQQIVVY